MGERLGRPLIAQTEIAYLDTDVVVWLALGSLELISPRAAALLETATLLISPMVLVELELRHEKSRVRTPGSFPQPAQHGSLRNLEAKHFQFSMNTRRTPGQVLGDHAEDEFAQFFAHAFSSRAIPMPREPCPIQLESSLVPAHDGLRLDEDQSPFPSRPKPPQDHPEQFI